MRKVSAYRVQYVGFTAPAESLSDVQPFAIFGSVDGLLSCEDGGVDLSFLRQ